MTFFLSILAQLFLICIVMSLHKYVYEFPTKQPQMYMEFDLHHAPPQVKTTTKMLCSSCSEGFPSFPNDPVVWRLILWIFSSQAAQAIPAGAPVGSLEVVRTTCYYFILSTHIYSRQLLFYVIIVAISHFSCSQLTTRGNMLEDQ